MHSDDPADAVLFAFKKKTEGRLDDVEKDIADLRHEMLTVRKDIARTHRVVVELQHEMRHDMQLVLAQLAELLGNGHSRG